MIELGQVIELGPVNERGRVNELGRVSELGPCSDQASEASRMGGSPYRAGVDHGGWAGYE